MEDQTMKKKLTVLLLVLVMIVASLGALTALTGCNGETENEGFLVGAIYINSKTDNSGYTYAHHQGIVKAMKELGMNPDTQLKIVDNVPEDYQQVTDAIDALAGQGCQLIIGISFGYGDAMAAAAKKPEYSDIIFTHATGAMSSLDSDDYTTSFNNYFGRIYQARYLSGIAAGLKASQGGKVGYVAAYGTEYAETCSGINAFALGVQAVNPTAEVIVKKLSTWGDQTKERQAAVELANIGCEVIAQHCDSSQPQIVAQEKGIFGCGYNSDMTSEAPDAHLTAPIWNWNVYYKLAIDTAMNDPENYMEKVTNYYGGLKEGFVDISPLSKNVTEDTADKIKQVRDLIISGEWDVFTDVKLSFDENGKLVMTDSTLLKADGNPVGVVDDVVIKATMNYYVKGVSEK